MTKQQSAEAQEAQARLRETLPPGSTVYCILRHVSRSGMQRVIDLIGEDHEWLTGLASRATGIRRDKHREGLVMGGCGMDMGFAAVSDLSRTLYPHGFGCIGERCPSNDHSNGDRDYTLHSAEHPHWHTEGGYALRHRWL